MVIMARQLHELKAVVAEQRGREAEAWKQLAQALERQLERAQERETELLAQIRMVMEERFARPPASAARETAPPSEPEGLADVDVFDPQADLAAIQAEEAAYRAQRAAAPDAEAHGG